MSIRDPNCPRDCPREVLADYIGRHGPIPTVRVSRAAARGRAGGYSYWGPARYEIRLRADGVPTHVPLERAPSARRSERLAAADADALAAREGRIRCNAPPGPITCGQAWEALVALRVEESDPDLWARAAAFRALEVIRGDE
jgi:hypothetical protein